MCLSQIDSCGCCWSFLEVQPNPKLSTRCRGADTHTAPTSSATQTTQRLVSSLIVIHIHTSSIPINMNTDNLILPFLSSRSRLKFADENMFVHDSYELHLLSFSHSSLHLSPGSSRKKKGLMKRLDVLQLWGTRLIQINSDQQLACIQLVPFILPSLVYFHAYSSSIYPDPSLSLSFMSQRNKMFLVAFSLLVPGFLHLYSHTYFLYHFLSHLDFTCCY